MVTFQAGLANSASAVTEFRLLNGEKPYVVGNPENAGAFNEFIGVLEVTSPRNGTPLCRHINEIAAQIRVLEPQLRAQNHLAAVIICTDGVSSDGDVIEALRPLHQLPVWVVVRLCTDEFSVTNYWNGVDKELELNLEILDDLIGEAKEIYKKNHWLTYGEPLHLLRQFGVTVKLFDVLDEQKLAPEQIIDLASIMYGL